MEEEADTDFTAWESIDDGIIFHMGNNDTIKRWAELYVLPKVELTLP